MADRSTPSKDVPITEDTFVDRSNQRGLAPGFFNFPEGEAFCKEGISMTCISLEIPETNEMLTAIITVADFDGEHLGHIISMTPTEARNLAASILNSANLIDGRGGVN